MNRFFMATVATSWALGGQLAIAQSSTVHTGYLGLPVPPVLAVALDDGSPQAQVQATTLPMASPISATDAGTGKGTGLSGHLSPIPSMAMYTGLTDQPRTEAARVLGW